MINNLAPELTDVFLGGAVALCGSAWLCSLLTDRLLRFGTSSSAQQERWLWYWSLMPWMVGLCAGLWLANPDWLGFWFIPHCHGDLCGVHAPELIEYSATAINSLLVLSLILAMVLGSRLWQLQRRHRQLQLMQHLSTLDRQRNIRLVPSTKRLAWCVGFWQPVIYLSQGLFDELTERERRLVLIHEHSHQWRRDNLRRWLLQRLLWCWLPQTRRRLISMYHQVTEHIADELVLQQGFQPHELTNLRDRMATSDPALASETVLPSASTATGRYLTTLLALLAIVQILLFGMLLHPLLDYLFLH
ncbi:MULTISPECIES: M56 family metallopeptidase [unclassified Oceanobacter]|uniref:M56 family metallopeptidase n=1 Tax=unclassified Oceanobacter TaxID=2620260 RepID=UPI0026E139D1|nr:MULTISPECIES: M56 family metallopeptidase [unclassified Oceanobacter]MDO6683483.1 M56 family metallopeptidase [Oceanobacter sp. 5_MG-2023]MDP2548448.1 M56 family metallopeptidase [Oceanobacter sp. 4_MG-2023]